MFSDTLLYRIMIVISIQLFALLKFIYLFFAKLTDDCH